MLAVLVPLGFHSIRYFDWLSHQRERIRLISMRVTRRRLVAHARRERRALIALFDAAAAEYLAARAGRLAAGPESGPEAGAP